MEFKDVSKDSWAYKAIEAFFEKGIVEGYEDGTFKPNGIVTRAEVAKILAKLLPAFDEKVSYKHEFSDVPSGTWYENYVAFCFQKNIIAGYPDGTFKPNNPITRAEIATICVRFKEVM